MQRELFGGAIALTLAPRFADISKFRQLPDTQEVFADATTDQSVIVEILEIAPESVGAHPARFHFDVLATDNGADVSSVEAESAISPVSTSPGGTVSQCWGRQRVQKFNDPSKNEVAIFIHCLRFPEHNTDVVLSYNSPTFIAAASSSAEQLDAAAAAMHNTVPASTAAFQAISNTLVIKDFGLFSG
eukprot:m.249137 g.249137  ORF g.249137 m.249137 type:complete len:187 (-) comp15975_c0_seq1:154-714(-)